MRGEGGEGEEEGEGEGEGEHRNTHPSACWSLHATDIIIGSGTDNIMLPSAECPKLIFSTI